MWSKNKIGGQIGRKLASLRRWITGLRFVALSLACGLLVWAIDAILDFFIFYKGEGTFFELLISDMPRHEAYIRSIILGCFLVFGIIISKAWTRRDRVKEVLQYQAHLLENVSDAIISFDIAEFRIVSWNQAAEALYGWRADEVMGKPMGEVVKAEYPHNPEGKMLDQFLEKGVWEGQVIHRRRDGTAIDILITVSQIKDNDGNPVGAVAVNHDITEQVRAEQVLRESEESERRFREQLRSALEVSNELSKALTFDDLCRSAIELGRSRLGFDRLGIWFLDEDSRFMVGSFGIDENGQLRDEQAIRRPVDPDDLEVDSFTPDAPMSLRSDVPLRNNMGKVVGQGWQIIAALWDGDRVIGFIIADNLLQRQPASKYQPELLGLYGSMLGYLCTRKRTEEEFLRRAALDRIRASVYAMSGDIDLGEVLISLSETLKNLELSFEACSIQLIDEDRCLQFMKEDSGIVEHLLFNRAGSSQENPPEGTQLRGIAVYEAWQNKQTVYRRDLDVEDSYNERKYLRKTYGRDIRSVLDVPFSYGTIAINSIEPDAFSQRDIELLEAFAGVLSEAYVRYTDVMERRRAEEALQKAHDELELKVAERTAELVIARERAEESDQLKSAFLSTMSHELRTPLNSIIGFTGIILQGMAGPLNDEQTKQLGMVRNSAHHLLDLINDVLDISKIEAGQVEIIAKPFDMREIIEKVMRTVTPLADKKGLLLMAEVTPQMCQITSDQRRVEQILINLVYNAVKFTEKGEVRIECEISDDWLVTRVADTGIGIKPEDMDTLFETFQQIDTGFTRQHDGTGLGLSICKRLVEMLGGQIRVESEWGVGSAFTLTLPMKMEVEDETQNTYHRG